MLSKVVAKVALMARATTTVVGLVIMLALVFGAATTAFGANGDNFILGSINNTATALTRLTANVQGPAMQVQNTNAGTDDAALALTVQPGEAPMRVNSDGLVNNLNADKLDGKEPSQIKGAKAYALVDPNEGPGGTPILQPNRTSGFTSVERTATGDYCLTAPGLNPATRPAEVSVEWYTTSPPEANAAAAFNSRPVCSNGRFAVRTERSVIVLDEEEGYVLRDEDVNDVGFVITVP